MLHADRQTRRSYSCFRNFANEVPRCFRTLTSIVRTVEREKDLCERTLTGRTRVLSYIDAYVLNLCFCIKADSHVACRAHAAPMPFPCHAKP